MARTKVDPTVVRPSCPDHPGSRIRLDGSRHCAWSDAHRRPRYCCVIEPGTRGHSFSPAVAVRQPTEGHPDSGTACPTCEHVYGRHEGVRTGRDFVFGHAEIARLLVRVGEGMSLRAASRDLREHLLRVADGDPSRAANLAVNYLDAFAEAILAELHPTAWPRVVEDPARRRESPRTDRSGAHPRGSGSSTRAQRPGLPIDRARTPRTFWTVATVDDALAVHFEPTIAITANGPEILTQV